MMFVVIKKGDLKNQIKRVSFTTPHGDVAINHKGAFVVYREGEFEIMGEERQGIAEAFDSGDQIHVPKPPEEGYMEEWPTPGWGDKKGRLSPENTVAILEEELAKARAEIDALQKELSLMGDQWSLDRKQIERLQRVVDALLVR